MPESEKIELKKELLIIFGTRPEYIKLAPVIAALKKLPEFKVTVCNAGQHLELLQSVADAFPITADYNLNLMEQEQSLWGFFGRCVSALGDLIGEIRPDAVIAQGDTSTTLASAHASFLNSTPFFHVEAGLRTNNPADPFPEEINRVLTTKLAALHFAPVERAATNLAREGIAEEKIIVTGNTVVDALENIKEKLPVDSPVIPGIRTVLLTVHRRENFGTPLLEICSAVRQLIETFSDINFLIPVHKNPEVSEIIRKQLGNIERVHLVAPLDYATLLSALRDCFFVMTDSGGLQEEAPSFGKPVLVLRKVTERPELIESGFGKLVGASAQTIFETAKQLLTDHATYHKMCANYSPFGDGHASDRIVAGIKQYFTPAHDASAGRD